MLDARGAGGCARGTNAIAWALATPAALFGAHRLLPVVWPRVLAAEGLQKTAVVAGASTMAGILVTLFLR